MTANRNEPWTIRPLNLGELTFREIVLRSNQSIQGNFIAFLLESGDSKILVDTGVPSQEQAAQFHAYTNPVIRKEHELENALGALGTAVDEIDTVLLTHLHWDHAMNVDKFPNARIVCSDVELAYAVNPLPPDYVAYEAPQMGFHPSWMKVLEAFDTVPLETIEIVPGVTLIPTPGHTPGHMSVVVESASGPHVICGDAVYTYLNLEEWPEKKSRYRMIGVYSEMRAAWHSMDRIVRTVDGDRARILPGHEATVLAKELYS